MDTFEFLEGLMIWISEIIVSDMIGIVKWIFIEIRENILAPFLKELLDEAVDKYWKES